MFFVLAKWHIKCDGRLSKMENRLGTIENKLNQYMEEHGRLQQQNQDLQRRVPETEKKNDKLTTKMSSLKETVGDIRLSNDKCQIEIKQLFKIIEEHFDNFIFNTDHVNESTTLNSNEVKSYSLHTPIRKKNCSNNGCSHRTSSFLRRFVHKYESRCLPTS